MPNIHSSRFSSLGKVRPPAKHIFGPHGNGFIWYIMILMSLGVRLRNVYMKKVSGAVISSL